MSKHCRIILAICSLHADLIFPCYGHVYTSLVRGFFLALWQTVSPMRFVIQWFSGGGTCFSATPE